MSYKIIRVCGTLTDLERAVNASGGIAVGAPFVNHESREWCQAVTMPLNITVKTPGEVKLREPKK
jgi:hypothetical protein